MFKQLNSLEKRIEDSARIIGKYPDRIPTIVERSTLSNNETPIIDKNKYLVPHDLTLAQFKYVLRKRMSIKPEQAIFIFINDNLSVDSETVKEAYAKNKDEDGFLYITYSFESTFG